MVKKLLPDVFLKNQNWAYFWINCLKFCTVCLYCMPSWGLPKLSSRPVTFTPYKAFLKKTRTGTSLPVLFSAWFLKEKISAVFY